MVLDVQLCRFPGVVGCVLQMALRCVRVVSRSFMVAGLVMAGGLPMVRCRMLMVFGGFNVMFRCLLRHVASKLLQSCPTALNTRAAVLHQDDLIMNLRISLRLTPIALTGTSPNFD